MNSDDLYSLLRRISATKDRSARMLILQENKDDQFLQFVVDASYNFFKNYGYESIQLPKRIGELELSTVKGFQIALEVLNDLNKGRVMNTNLDWYANSFLEKYNLESQLILSIILVKQDILKLTQEDIEEVWPNLLPKFESSGGFPYTYRYCKLIWNNQEDYFVSQVHNGIRCFIIKDYAGNIKMYTIRRRPVKIARRLLEEINILLRNQYAVVLEGYFKRANENGDMMRLDTRRLGNTAIQLLRPRFLVLDILPLKNFIDKTPSPNFIDRYNLLKEIFSQIDNYRIYEYSIITDKDGQTDYQEIDKGGYELQYTFLIKQYRVTEQITKKLIYAWYKNKWSGLLFRKNTPFFTGNSSEIIKLDRLFFKDYEVIEVIKKHKSYYIKNDEGKRVCKYNALVKSIIIKHNNKFVFVDYGFDNEFELKYGENPDLLKGRVITVGYLNEDKQFGLRYPMFIKLNGEKDEE